MVYIPSVLHLEVLFECEMMSVLVVPYQLDYVLQPITNKGRV